MKKMLLSQPRGWLAALLVVGVLFWNWRFVDWCALPLVLTMNDVDGIVRGYEQTPHLLLDGLKWWHGPWIQDGIQTFRPVSSYLLWCETAIGLRWGFFWVGCIGILLLLGVCSLCVLLSWQWTKSKWCAALTAVLAPMATVWNFNGTQPHHWMVWYPVHHDLLMIGCLVGALWAFDAWMESAAPRYLALTWAFFVTGLLSKEFLYIFPVLAAICALRVRSQTAIGRYAALRQAALMLVLVLALFCYRAVVLPQPYNPPPLKWVHLKKKPFLYWFWPFYGFMLSGLIGYAGLAGLLLILGGAWLRFKRSAWGHWSARPFAWAWMSALALLILAVYSEWVLGSALGTVWYFVEPREAWLHITSMLHMVGLFYVLYLLWKHRRSEPGLAAWGLMAFAYAPVFTYLGWHYTLAGWFIRCAVYWPVIARIVWREWEMPLRRVASGAREYTVRLSQLKVQQ
jgi:hypothetical protein